MGRRGQRSAARTAKRAEAFHKTKMCPAFVAGECSKGDRCTFAHNTDELEAPPDLSFTKLCRSWIAGEVCPKTNCRHAHGYGELRFLPRRGNKEAVSTGKTEHSQLTSKVMKAELEDVCDVCDEVESVDETTRPNTPTSSSSASGNHFGPDAEVVVHNTFIAVRRISSGRSPRSTSTPPAWKMSMSMGTGFFITSDASTSASAEDLDGSKGESDFA